MRDTESSNKIAKRGGYAELQAISNFSFLRGASHPEELICTAAALGYDAIALTDVNSLAGAVRAHIAAKDCGIPFILGCRLEMRDEGSPLQTILAYPTNRASYGRLCRLLTIAKTRADKDRVVLGFADLLAHQKDLVTIAVPSLQILEGGEDQFREGCQLLRENSSDPRFVLIAAHKVYQPCSKPILTLISRIGKEMGIPLVATNDIYYHLPERRPLQDTLTCIHHKCNIPNAGYLLSQNEERHLKPVTEMKRLFRDLPQAINRTLEIAEICSHFSLDDLRYEYPVEVCPEGRTPLEYLSELTFAGAHQYYPAGIPEHVLKLIDEELRIIHELQYEQYFLTCYDIVRFARSKGILCQGRGAAANSAVCFCLKITAVDPTRIGMLFARFVSRERNEPPDIDIDFEHERREEVIQYIYQKYGREYAGLTCEVITYRFRSAVRDVGKALGLSLDVVDRIAKSLHYWTECKLTDDDYREIGISPGDPVLRNLLALSKQLLGFPRHLSQHVGGFVICRQPLCESVPISNARMEERTIIEWDKDDIEALGMLKIDILGLGMLTCVRKAIELVNMERLGSGQAPMELSAIPSEDPQVYQMICEADTVGVFQIESRAQMSMLPRLRPQCFYDLVIEVAIVRPGPIQGDMVHPYLKRRSGLEKLEYPNDEIKAILSKTLGVPLFQEQAMQLAVILADFTPGEAEQLRRAIASWKRKEGLIAKFTGRVITRMLEKGYSREFAEQCMSQILGFSGYGFPESHAASFALIVYSSAWLKRYHPAIFAAALLNSQPMGFYAPSQIVSDAAQHGVTIRAPSINHSSWDCSLEKGALRLGLRLVKGLAKSQVEILTGERIRAGRYCSLQDLWMRGHRHGLTKQALLSLANADALQDLSLSRREAIWEILSLPSDDRALDHLETRVSSPPPLPTLSKQQEMFRDYSTMGLSLRAHPFTFVRPLLDEMGVRAVADLRDSGLRGMCVSLAGIGFIRQRPGTAKGVTFISLEDETGVANIIIWPKLFDRFRRVILSSTCILAVGALEHVGKLVYVTVERLESLDQLVLENGGDPIAVQSYSY